MKYLRPGIIIIIIKILIRQLKQIKYLHSWIIIIIKILIGAKN